MMGIRKNLEKECSDLGHCRHGAVQIHDSVCAVGDPQMQNSMMQCATVWIPGNVGIWCRQSI